MTTMKAGSPQTTSSLSSNNATYDKYQVKQMPNYQHSNKFNEFKPNYNADIDGVMDMRNS